MVDDAVAEGIAEIEHIEGDAQAVCHQAGVFRVGQAAAAAVFFQADVLVAEHAERHARHIVSGFLQEQGRRTAVDAAAHGH